MTFEEQLKLFCENLRLYLKSVEWLKRSLKRVGEISNFQNPSFSHFSRSIDILLNRVLRNLDLLELEEPLRKLDIEEALLKRLDEVRETSEKLIEITEKLFSYIRKMGYKCPDLKG